MTKKIYSFFQVGRIMYCFSLSKQKAHLKDVDNRTVLSSS